MNSSSVPSRLKTITIVGSRELDAVAVQLLDWMQAQDGYQVLLRCPNSGEASMFEHIISLACRRFNIPFGWMKPGVGGRAAVFNRDITMVGKSDLVLAFFLADEMSGGTEHVVEKAIDQFVPVYSYGRRDSKLVLIGSHDPHGTWVGQEIV